MNSDSGESPMTQWYTGCWSFGKVEKKLAKEGKDTFQQWRRPGVQRKTPPWWWSSRWIRGYWRSAIGRGGWSWGVEIHCDPLGSERALLNCCLFSFVWISSAAYPGSCWVVPFTLVRMRTPWKVLFRLNSWSFHMKWRQETLNPTAKVKLSQLHA